MLLESKVFKNDMKIPVRYTGEGEDLSPPLAWTDVHKDARSFALVCEDVDCRVPPHRDATFVHWLLYNIPADTRALPEGAGKPQLESLEVPFSAEQGTNSFGKLGYSGPLPPEGKQGHRYVFSIYALDEDLQIPPGIMLNELMKYLEGHVVGTAQLLGHYTRAVGGEHFRSIPSDRPSPELGL